MKKTGWNLLVLACSLLLGTGPSAWSQPAAKPQPAAGVSIQEIQLRVFDRQKDALVPPEESSDPYGMNSDAVLVVRIQGTWEGEGALVLKLSASAPTESSEATGKDPGWKVTQSRKLSALSENGVTSVPFLLPYDCSSQVKVTATLTGPGVKSSKTFSTSFPCAE
ncbi:hypothetical protein [Hyalangium rubrum]|uniref:Lipoprotein n=1 Tax=Hyalangium rubrum TaxID=3103134 RepID=A0ABU5HDV9_9BACT|nr:hypothetical protein [Hyalangium sp. s54d21]MDY7231666.1 hypothetical protein [Hyalangium sp. s54d21]